MKAHHQLFADLAESFNAGRCLSHVAQICSTDRWFSFDQFERTAAYCAEQMRAAGLAEVELLGLKADGNTRYEDWVMPMAWDARNALLRFFKADAGEPALADYHADPCSLMMFSAPTPPGGIVAEVAAIDDPSVADPASLQGKLILTAARPGALVPLAKAGGAVGILSDFYPLYASVRDTPDEMVGHSRWENDLTYPVNGTGIFGFSLSPENGARLRRAVAEAAEQGSAVTLHAAVDTCFYPGVNHTVSGLIPGSDPAGREILLCAHLYEPGANDNASGCGALLELATAIRERIAAGLLPQPRFGIRFAMGYECVGLMGYYAGHRGTIGRMAAAINMDMVGSSAEDRAVLSIWHNPLSNWSFMDTLLPALAREYQAYTGEWFEFTEAPFSLGDNLLADPSIGIPTVSMIMHPAQSYHSSMDGMSRVDSSVLKRNSLIAGAAALTVALPDPAGLLWLVEEVGRHRQAVLHSETGLRKAMMTEAFRRASIGLTMLADTYSVGQPPSHPPYQPALLASDVHTAGMDCSGMIPVRLVPGTLTLAGLAGKPRETLKWYPYYDYRLNCPLFWADGTRSVAEIALLSAAELGIGDVEAYRKELCEYFLFLKDLNYISIY